ncbi:MAG: CotH kinase family protein, partial [Verrucomicrobiales bacterium]
MGVTRRAIVCVLLCGFTSSAPAAISPGKASLFTASHIAQISIRVDERGLATLGDHPRTYVPAQVKVDGDVWEQVGLRIKGRQGSLRAVDDKPSLTLDFDHWRLGQACHGQTKLHLNNCVEDPTYLNEVLAAWMCERARISFPRVAHATVSLNGRNLGLFLLKQSFEDMLQEKSHPPSSLYEPVRGGDVDQPFERKMGPEPPPGQALADLARIAQEPDLSLRQEDLKRLLKITGFLQFMSMEVLLGHRDGYCISKNNVRLSFDPITKQWEFLLAGTDQLLGNPKLPWQPEMSGLVARSVLQVPEFKRAYRSEFERLL